MSLSITLPIEVILHFAHHLVKVGFAYAVLRKNSDDEMSKDFAKTLCNMSLVCKDWHFYLRRARMAMSLYVHTFNSAIPQCSLAEDLMFVFTEPPIITKTIKKLKKSGRLNNMHQIDYDEIYDARVKYTPSNEKYFKIASKTMKWSENPAVLDLVLEMLGHDWHYIEEHFINYLTSDRCKQWLQRGWKPTMQTIFNFHPTRNDCWFLMQILRTTEFSNEKLLTKFNPLLQSTDSKILPMLMPHFDHPLLQFVITDDMNPYYRAEKYPDSSLLNRSAEVLIEMYGGEMDEFFKKLISYAVI